MPGKRKTAARPIDVDIDCPKCKGTGLLYYKHLDVEHSYTCLLCNGQKKVRLVAYRYHLKELLYGGER